MKRLVLLLALLGCPSESVDPPPAVPADWKAINEPPVAKKGLTISESAIAEAYVVALASPKLSGLVPLFDEISHIAFGHHDARGRDKVIEVHETLFGAFEQRKVVLTRAWRTDDAQVVEWVLTGVHEHDWMAIPATHKPVVIRGVTFVWTQDVGTVMDAHVYFSIPVVKAELGVGPKELIDYVASLPPPSMTPGTPVDQDKAPAEKQNEKVVRDMLDNFENKREADFMAAYADNVEVETLSHGKTTKKDDIRSYYRSMHKMIGQLDTTVISEWGVAQYAIVEYHVDGEQLGSIGWIPAQRDRAIRFEIVDICEIRDGKIARVWRYDNPIEISE